MKYYLPQISWHDRSAILSLDFQLDEAKLETGRYKLVTSSVANEVRVWEFGFDTEEKLEAGGKPALAVDFIANLSGHNSAVNVVRFSPNGLKLASGDSDGRIYLWQVNPPTSAPDIFAANKELPPNKENWTRYRTLYKHINDVCDLCWSPDGLRIASVSLDKSLIIFNTETGEQQAILKDFKQFPNGVCWDPRGKYVLTLSTDREMHVIGVEPPRFPRLRRVIKADLPQFPDFDNQAGSFRLFYDDQLMSFVRRSDFSADGELLIVPSGLLEMGKENISVSYVFLRGNLESPVAILPYSSATYMARCCPVLFTLRQNEEEENYLQLPHRVVFALMTKDSVLLYDSQHTLPFAFVDNIHYSNLTDIAWSADGRVLLVSSIDGYCSFIRFDDDELGQRAVNIPTPPPSPKMLPLPKRQRATPKATPNPEGDKTQSETTEEGTPTGKPRKSKSKLAETTEEGTPTGKPRKSKSKSAETTEEGTPAGKPRKSKTVRNTPKMDAFLIKPAKTSDVEQSKVKESAAMDVSDSPASSKANTNTSVENSSNTVAEKAVVKPARRVQLISFASPSIPTVVKPTTEEKDQ